jgi:hypothetical protein
MAKEIIEQMNAIHKLNIEICEVNQADQIEQKDLIEQKAKRKEIITIITRKS